MQPEQISKRKKSTLTNGRSKAKAAAVLCVE